MRERERERERERVNTCNWYNTRNVGLFLGASFISFRGSSCSQRREMHLVFKTPRHFLDFFFITIPLGQNIHLRQQKKDQNFTILLSRIFMSLSSSLSTSMSLSKCPSPLEQYIHSFVIINIFYQCHNPNAPLLLTKIFMS